MIRPNRRRLPLDQQVHVIGHQAVSVEQERQPALLDFEQREKPLVVVIVLEDLLTIVATRNYVIETLDFNAWLAGHRARVLSDGRHRVK
jgi:hypothetical protein